MLKTVEIPQLQFIVGLGMHQIETVQKLWSSAVAVSSGFVQFWTRLSTCPLLQCVDNLVDVPVVQLFLDMVEMPVVVQRQVLGL